MILPPFPLPGNVDFQAFGGSREPAQLVYRTWTKPHGCSQIFMLAAGSGAGGAGGTSGVSGTRTGGGGGGSGSITRMLIPACVLPDVLYLRLPPATGGGAPGVNGTQGGSTLISVAPDAATDNQNVMRTGFAGAGISSSGSAGSGGTGLSGAPLSAWGIMQNNTGQGGSAGGVGAAGGVFLTASTSSFLTGGAGGGGVGTGNGSQPGGGINPQATATGAAFRAKIIEGGSTGGKDGKDGFNRGLPLTNLRNWTTPIMFTGGSGGQGVNDANPGVGGHGAWGCGGGGGGGGITGGRGGDGGPGFILIWAW